MKKLPLSIVFSILLLAVIAGPSSADRVYTWTDKDGTVHFGDQAQYLDTRQVNIRVNYKVDHHALQRNRQREKILKSYAQDEKEKAEKLAEQQSEEARKRIRCERARKAQQSYQSAKQLYRKDKSGNKIMLSAEQHKQALEEVNRYLSKWCS